MQRLDLIDIKLRETRHAIFLIFCLAPPRKNGAQVPPSGTAGREGATRWAEGPAEGARQQWAAESRRLVVPQGVSREGCFITGLLGHTDRHAKKPAETGDPHSFIVTLLYYIYYDLPSFYFYLFLFICIDIWQETDDVRQEISGGWRRNKLIKNLYMTTMCSKVKSISLCTIGIHLLIVFMFLLTDYILE